MNQEIKDQWVKALKSGEYKQGYGKLAVKMSNGQQKHCCLGVLCELAVEAGIVEKIEVPMNVIFDDDDYEATMFEYEGEQVPDTPRVRNRTGYTLPERVKVWAGLDSDNPGVTRPHGYETTLSELNDSKIHNFEDIANIINEGL